MVHYVDHSAQTLIQGLTRDPAARPAVLIPQADTTTPPDDMAIDKAHLGPDLTNTFSKASLDDRDSSPLLLLKRKKRPPMVARISLPAPDFEADTPRSPPPTGGLFSPLPAANKLHAGHTPIIPRALSPLPADDTSIASTPSEEEVLSGPLTLPPQPGDGAEDTIPLTVLDAQLEKIRKEQEKAEMHSAPAPPVEHGAAADPLQCSAVEVPCTRMTSTDSASSNEVNFVDGVILKPPKMNMGAPLGQA